MAAEPAYRLATEVFALPYLGEKIVYAPLVKASLLVNDSAVDVLGRIGTGASFDETPENIELVALLHDLGIVSFQGEVKTFAEVGRHRQEGPYRPVAGTLFLTSDCNLRCRYCYARGGEHPRSLHPAIAHAAIDFVVQNAHEAGEERALIAFHGGGEPTTASALLVECVEHAEAACDAAGVKPVLALATNGVMLSSMRDFLAEHFDSVMVSLDGTPTIQDRMRPRASGGGSFDAATKTLRRLAESDCNLGVRVTVSDATVDDLVSSVRCILDTAHVDTIHLEPLFSCGRSLGSGLEPPKPDRFVEAYRLCRGIAACADVDVMYSAARTNAVTDSFCEVSAPSFNVTPDGDVTACYEVADRDDARADWFVFGHYDGASGFVFDEDRISALRGLTVEHAARCANCFCKYHCAGDCPAKRLYPDAGEPLAGRCTITRRLTQDLIEESLLGAGEGVLIQALREAEDDGAVAMLGESLGD